MKSEMEMMAFHEEIKQKITTTRTKIEQVIKKYKIDELPDDVKKLIAYVDDRRKKEKIDGWQLVRNIAAKLVGDIDKYNK